MTRPTKQSGAFLTMTARGLARGCRTCKSALNADMSCPKCGPNRRRFEYAAVSRPGWVVSGATNCTHAESGATVWMRDDCWHTSVGETLFRCRDGAMEHAEAVISERKCEAEKRARNLGLDNKCKSCGAEPGRPCFRSCFAQAQLYGGAMRRGKTAAMQAQLEATPVNFLAFITRPRG